MQHSIKAIATEDYSPECKLELGRDSWDTRPTALLLFFAFRLR